MEKNSTIEAVLRTGTIIMAAISHRLVMLVLATQLAVCCESRCQAQDIIPLANTQPLTATNDLAMAMVEGIDRYLARVQDASVISRQQFWKRDFSSAVAYEKSIQPNRARLRRILGIGEEIEHSRFRFPTTEAVFDAQQPALVLENDKVRVYKVTWPVMRDVHGEGLLLEPRVSVRANVIAIPDCEQIPEELIERRERATPSAFPRQLAESGCRVLVPYLINRSDTNSGLPGVRKARLAEREYLWRACYELGRHPIGYDVQKVIAGARALDDYAHEHPQGNANGNANGIPRLGMIGYGEGGLTAFYAAAVEPKIEVCAVSGYFQPRENLWTEPIYRNVWSLLHEFGDAEVASLIAPRPLIIESGKFPNRVFPGKGEHGEDGAPGKLPQPQLTDVRHEIERANSLVSGLQPNWKVEAFEPDKESACVPQTLSAFLNHIANGATLESNLAEIKLVHSLFDGEQGKRQYLEIVNDTQHLMRESEYVRVKDWASVPRTNLNAFVEAAKSRRDYFWEEFIGKLPEASLPPNPRSRRISETDKFTGYEVVLDVYPDVFAEGIFLVPKDVKPGDKRPVIVCQHGLEGRPRDVADPKIDHYAYHTYACRLAERGFVVFAPQNPYIGSTKFRQVLHRAQPLKLTLFAFIVRQHEAILNWISKMDFVDPERMAFYGLSYGGKTAMRIPAILEQYCLSICSADYNEWIWKNVSARSNYSYLYNQEYDMPEFDLASHFNYAEMSWLISPRPFMVERGHDDGVAPDEWVSYEYAKTRRHYVKLGLADRTRIEFFNGPHTINGKGTFEFLHEQLKWPAPQ